jgi:hypothetical protein
MTMIGYSDDAKMMELLAPLRRLEPVPFSMQPVSERRLLRKPVLVAAVLLFALALTGVAIADGVGAFNGIGAAQHPQSAADLLGPQELSPDCSSAVASPSAFCNLDLGSARLVRTLPSGRKVWVATDSHGDLCVFLQEGGASCGSELTPTRPTTLASFKKGPGVPLITYGVALDGIVAVSFIAGGEPVSVPVEDNVWAYEGPNSAFQTLTVHYADGSTFVLSY